MSERLSKYFTGVAVKRLSAVEAEPSRSHQHELNGVTSLRKILGGNRQQFPARFVYLAEEEEDALTSDASVTWYDAREAIPGRTEWRLYFPQNAVMDEANEGDYLILGLRPDNTLLIAVAKQGLTQENQLEWLFNLPREPGNRSFFVKEIGAAEDKYLGLAEKMILAQIQVEVTETDDNFLEQMLRRFNGTFPRTSDFSAFARETLVNIDPVGNPDATLAAWLEHEEVLFRTLERHIVSVRLREGFGVDVDTFIKFSLSVQNRRKSRAGFALENHLEQIFRFNQVRYSRDVVTENKSRPDFVFPGIAFYHDPSYPNESLTMLGVKSTCKDRWRQVLAEAVRINRKHLLTLEPGISLNQTNEMRTHELQLVVPAGIHPTYRPDQRDWLIDVASFVSFVRSKQPS